MSDTDWLKTSRDLLIGLAGKCMWHLFADWSCIGVVSVISTWSLHALCAGKMLGSWKWRNRRCFGNCGPITCKRNVQLLNLLHSPFLNYWPSLSITPQSLNESKTVLQKQKFIQKVQKWGGVKPSKTSIITYIITYNYKNMQFLTPALTVYHSTHRVMSVGPVLGWSMNVHTNTIVQFDTRQKQFICAGHVPSSTLPVVTASSSDLCPRLLPQPPLASLFGTRPNPWP